MYYEIHAARACGVAPRRGYGNFGTGTIGRRAFKGKVIAVEMQGHGRTATSTRSILRKLSDDVAGLLDYLKIPSGSIVTVWRRCRDAVCDRHPKYEVRQHFSPSAATVGQEANDFGDIHVEIFKGTPMEAEYRG